MTLPGGRIEPSVRLLEARPPRPPIARVCNRPPYATRYRRQMVRVHFACCGARRAAFTLSAFHAAREAAATAALNLAGPQVTDVEDQPPAPLSSARHSRARRCAKARTSAFTLYLPRAAVHVIEAGCSDPYSVCIPSSATDGLPL